MIGKRLYNYKIESLIDEGGMGTVYLGVHMHLGRKVAIKSLNPLLLQKPEIKERFKNEAIALSKLHHPNIVALYDYIETPEGVFLILEYIEGTTLDEYLEKISGPIPEHRVISLFIKMLDAMAYIHSKNIIHRDVKPGNFIITTDNDIKILDFGIAKILGDTDPKLTVAGTKVGTTLYMSPQQVKGQMLDRRTDIYSLGVTLFQLVTGQYPYDKNISEYDLYNKIVNEPLPNPKDFYIGVSDKMQQIIAKATAKKPLDRYQNCEEFSAALFATQDNMEQPTLSLKTKILEFRDLNDNTPIFNQSFWHNFVLTFITIIFLGAIGIAIYSIQREDIMHVISDKAWLMQNDSTNAEKIETLNYGETVKLIESNADKNNIQTKWQQVISLRGTVGFIEKNQLASPKIYQQINSIFGNIHAQALTPVDYKWLLRKYFIENQFFDKFGPVWKIYAQPKKEFDFNSICEGDFNNNQEPDFACVLFNKTNKKSRLILFFEHSETTIAIEFEDQIKIKTLIKGNEGGSWYLGNQYTKKNEKGIDFLANRYEFLPTDAILVYKPDKNENIIYYFDAEENKIKYFVQPK